MSIKGLVENERGDILLVIGKNRLWELPGGGLEHGEEPIGCLKREIFEETGLSVVDVSVEPRYFLTAPNWDNRFHVANVVYQIQVKNLNFTPSEECHGLRFFTIKEMRQVSIYPTVERLVTILEAERAGSHID